MDHAVTTLFTTVQRFQEVQSSVTSSGDETSSGIVSDEEIDKQKLEAHSGFMAKIQEVLPAESSSTDTPLKQCLYSANHDECVLEYISRLNPRASAQNKDAKSHKTTKRFMPVEKSSGIYVNRMDLSPQDIGYSGKRHGSIVDYPIFMNANKLRVKCRKSEFTTKALDRHVQAGWFQKLFVPLRSQVQLTSSTRSWNYYFHQSIAMLRDNSHKVVRLGINPMIQPEPEDLPKDNPKLEIAVLSVMGIASVSSNVSDGVRELLLEGFLECVLLEEEFTLLLLMVKYRRESERGTVTLTGVC
ncbi:hypothetical protein Tco_0523377 [Tanacetum coccineum]